MKIKFIVSSEEAFKEASSLIPKIASNHFLDKFFCFKVSNSILIEVSDKIFLEDLFKDKERFFQEKNTLQDFRDLDSLNPLDFISEVEEYFSYVFESITSDK